jgi:hypothetical protein
MTVFDPAADDFTALMQAWMSNTAGQFAVMHDRSKPLKQSEALLRAYMSNAPTRFIGYGVRKQELPLRVSELEFADSEANPPLQLADVLAGAVVDWCLVNSGKRPRSEYHLRLASTRLPELCVGTMLPSREFTASTAPLPASGEVSLVDGNTAYLREVGFLDKMP